jgi:hypothetical protein
MKKLLLNVALAVSASTFAQTANTEALKLYFAKDQFDLTENSKHKLDSLLGTITDPSEELLLVGHTDSDADVSYNKTLSLNRTRAVQSYLYDHDVRNRIHIDWKGESKPINANKDEGEKTLNRRVEIIRNYREDSNQLEKLSKPEQTFVINPSRDTILVGKEGTQVFIRAGSFIVKDPNAPVEIKLTEFYKKSDFILNNLSTTTTQDELLESGGTIDIQASSGNETVMLKQGASLQVLFKDKKADDNMQAYYAREGETVTKWSKDPQDKATMEPILISKAFKIKNLDTMEIVSELIMNVDGLNYKALKTEKRGHPNAPFVEEMKMTLLDPAEIAQSIFFSTDRALTLRSMGRVNCDKLLAPENTRTVMIEVDNNIIPSVTISLDTNNSVIPYSRRENNVYIFDNIPIDASFDVTAVYLDDQGILFGQIKNRVISNKTKTENLVLHMKRSTETDLRLAVQEMDDKRSTRNSR